MNKRFDNFIENIPKNIHLNTKSYISKNIAIFMPEEFIVKNNIMTTDYHFVIFHTTPPLIEIGDQEFQFKKGSFICIEPGLEITVHPIHTISPVKFISIIINKYFFEKVALQIIAKGKINFTSRENTYSHVLLDLTGLLIEELISFGDHCPLMIECLETQMAIQLLRDSLPDSLIHRKNKFTDNDYIDQSIKYMQDHYSSNIKISEICSAIYVSSCHFQRIFKKHMEQTPYNYLMDFRVNKAKEKLINDGTNIEEIARLCGFVSTAHFSSVFKRKEGISPSEFRKFNLSMDK